MILSKHNNFDSIDPKVFDGLIDKTFPVAAYCFNCTKSDDRTRVNVRVLRYDVASTPRSAARVVLRVLAEDDGQEYTLPDWALFTLTGTVNGLGQQKRVHASDRSICARATRRSHEFAKLCRLSGARVITVLDGATGCTSRALRAQGLVNVYQVNYDATALIANACMGDVAVHTMTSVRNARRRSWDVYEMLRVSLRTPSAMCPTAMRACRASAFALDIYGTWRPGYDAVLAELVKRRDVRVLLITYCTRNSVHRPTPLTGYISTNEESHALMRWVILIRLECATPRSACIYHLGDMTPGSMLLTRAARVGAVWSFVASSSPHHLLRVVRLCLQTRTLDCEVLRPSKRRYNDRSELYESAAFAQVAGVARVSFDRLAIVLSWDVDPTDRCDALPQSIRKQIDLALTK
ncbi:hypothetical protein CYMTET_2598 [Cymbomonas tetramitiformis]|uniref:Uncharacterized protein n=1 Tax=Cymbomonas tetramitiformis TaxID=36881 RepID=A0AAE0H5C0_9CHLO|nr:hypothetical protein CYMTET_2764 [Cymbomonas tetramitiformis]KAK3289995.1 hypothetical protein CYMTET_2598 [Cymbomonas tetramitiformis]